MEFEQIKKSTQDFIDCEKYDWAMMRLLEINDRDVQRVVHLFRRLMELGKPEYATIIKIEQPKYWRFYTDVMGNTPETCSDARARIWLVKTQLDMTRSKICLINQTPVIGLAVS